MTEVAVAGRVVRLSSLDRVVWPEVGVTKAELVDYYTKVAPVLLPHLADRPVTLRRFPEGVGGPQFFQTRTPSHPPWLRTVTMRFPRTGKAVDAPVVDDLAALVWAANLTTIELHPFLATASALDRPTAVVFDLDPGPPAHLGDAVAVALRLRDLLEPLGLAAWPKTSGGKGLHVYVPLNSDHTYAETKAFARAVAAALARKTPDRVVDRMTKSLRVGKVFIDWSQNDFGKSTVAPYSLRGLRVPTVSTPVGWAELERAARTPERLLFTPADVLQRVDRHGDMFAPVLDVVQRLPAEPRVG